MIESLLQEGISALRTGRRTAARQMFLRITREEPSHDLGWFWLASVTESLQMRLSYLRKARDLNPDNVETSELWAATRTQFVFALLAQGKYAAKSGLQDFATYFLLHAAELDPGNEAIWLALAQLETPPEDTAELLRRVLAINPGNTRAIAMLQEIEGESGSTPEDTNLTVPLQEPASKLPASEEPEPELIVVLESADSDLPVLTETALAPEENTDLELTSHSATTSALFAECPADQPPVFPPGAPPAAPEASCETAPSKLSLAKPPDPLLALEIECVTPQEPAPQAASAPPAESEISFLAPLTSCPLCEHQLETDCEQCPRCGGRVVLKHFLMAPSGSAKVKFDRRHSLLAVARYGQVLTKDPGNAQAHYCLGLAYLNLNRLDVALRCLRRAEELRPDGGLSATISELAKMPALPTPGEPPANGQTASSAGGKDHTPAQRSIMIVDDSPTIRKLVAQMLEKSGYHVIPAIDGSDALAKIADANPDLVLLDIVMPNLDGYQVCKLIREKKKDIPIVMLSGRDGFFDKVRGRVAGSTAYITKPFDAQTLIETAGKYCGTQS